MNTALTLGLAKRMLGLLDRRETDLAPTIMYEPTEVYTSAELQQRERDTIFGRTPMFMGLSADIPVAGSWRAFEIADTPLLLCRDRAGVARLHLNSCRHRGVKIAEGAGRTNSLVCRFHGWRYGLEGALLGVPEPEGFEELCREDHGLIELPSAEKYGMLFGRPTTGAPIDVDELLCGLGPELGDWGFDSYCLYTEHHLHPFRGNWKFAWDTFCENYHFAVPRKDAAFTPCTWPSSPRQMRSARGSTRRCGSAARTSSTARTSGSPASRSRVYGPRRRPGTSCSGETSRSCSTSTPSTGSRRP